MLIDYTALKSLKHYFLKQYVNKSEPICKSQYTSKDSLYIYFTDMLVN
jgi:hypothetical protein